MQPLAKFFSAKLIRFGQICLIWAKLRRDIGKFG